MSSISGDALVAQFFADGQQMSGTDSCGSALRGTEMVVGRRGLVIEAWIMWSLMRIGLADGEHERRPWTAVLISVWTELQI